MSLALPAATLWPSTVAVMSDAATATIVSASSSAEFAFLTKGSSAKVLECGASGPIKMDGFGVFKFVASEVTSFLRSMITECGKPDSFVPHQANLYMVRQLARSLGLEDVLCLAGETFANPGSASVPLSLAVNEVKGKTLLAAFGAGLSASAAMVDLSAGYKRKSIEV